MSASTSLAEVEKMLSSCAPGYTIRLANHSRVIHFAEKVYRNFPKHDPVENGHVRKLVRFFVIGPCAAKLMPRVIKDEHPVADKHKASVDDAIEKLAQTKAKTETKGRKKR